MTTKMTKLLSNGISMTRRHLFGKEVTTYLLPNQYVVTTSRVIDSFKERTEYKVTIRKGIEILEKAVLFENAGLQMINREFCTYTDMEGIQRLINSLM